MSQSLMFRIRRIFIPEMWHRMPTDPLPEDSVHFLMNTRLVANHRDDEFIIEIRLQGEDKETKHEHFKIVALFIFEVKGLDPDYNPEEGPLKIERDLIVSMVGVSFSTLRGILFERLAGTLLQLVLLPVVNPSEIVTELESEAEIMLIDSKSPE